MPLSLGAEDRDDGVLLPRGPPLPDQGGRSLRMLAVFWAGPLPARFEPKPCCGRSLSARREFWAGALFGRFDPKPSGARPRSVALPCASQVRGLLPDRAEGGRFCIISRCRAVVRLFAWAFNALLSRLAFALAELLACGFPNRPGLNSPLFTVRTGELAAREEGAVRAITDRPCTPAGGRATCELKFAAPNVLCWVGRMPTEFVTRAPFNEPCVRPCPARLMRPPLTKLLCEVVVTARRLCAFTKLTLRTFAFRILTLRINVLWTLITLTKPRLQGNHGKNGSPQPSGNQPTLKPNPKPQPPPRKPTNAGP